MNKAINEQNTVDTLVGLQLDGVVDNIEKVQAVLFAAIDACSTDIEGSPKSEILIEVACDILDNQVAVIRKIILSDEVGIDERINKRLAELSHHTKVSGNEVNTI